jgi:hypothetical protein
VGYLQNASIIWGITASSLSTLPAALLA